MGSTTQLESEVPWPGLERYYVEFLTTRREEVSTLKNFLAENNFKEIAQLAHRWKGFCTPYGFGKLAEYSTDLEVTALSSDHNQCAQLIDRIQGYLASK